ncbi:MAG: signal peptidase II [Thermoguttaceae bacterium]|jgi:signal peptidase II
MRAVPASRYLLFLAIAAGGCAADLATKHWVFDRLGMPGGPTWWLRPGVLGFQTSLNEGALFGMGQGMVPVFAVLSVGAMAGIVWWLFWAGAARQWLLTAALASITGGVLGNLYDRLGLPGLRWNFPNPLHHAGQPVYAVRDFVLVMLGPWQWPNFNLADSMLVCGAALLVGHAFWTRESDKQERPA